MPRGRPTKYKKEYCQQLIEHMGQGLSFESFAGTISVTDRVLYNWLDKHPDFLQAQKIGKHKCMIFWEKIGVAGAAGKIQNFNAATWIFNMKNRFGWVNELQINKKETNVNVQITGKLDDIKHKLTRGTDPLKDVTPLELEAKDDNGS